jgi:hypothetical protein
MLRRTEASAITVERVRALLEYNPETGEFKHRVARGNRHPGQPAGAINGEGRRTVVIDRVIYGGSRLAWFYMTGAWPQHQVDHIDTDRSNDRWVNLRDVPASLNAQNVRKPQNRKQKSKLLGARWCNSRKKWKAAIRINRKEKWLGYFETDQEASEAFIAAKRKYHAGCTL